MTLGEAGARGVWDSADGVALTAGGASEHDRRKDFWAKESVHFSRPWYRIEKSARIVRGLAGRKTFQLLDVGCGPAALQQLMPPNVSYYGLDISVGAPAPNLVECDFVEEPIKWGEKRFDIVVAQGVFEYAGEVARAKLGEISELLVPKGFLVASYTNFTHRKPYIYSAYTNVVPITQFASYLGDFFQIVRSFPASHNWKHGQPGSRLNRRLNMGINLNVPFASKRLAVEYFFVCQKA
jgi:SAM-dependent methyltransferase